MESRTTLVCVSLSLYVHASHSVLCFFFLLCLIINICTDLGGNPSTSFMLVYALLAGAVGLCSLLSGLVHLRAWRSDSLASATSLSTLSLAITAIAFGYFHSFWSFHIDTDHIYSLSYISHQVKLHIYHLEHGKWCCRFVCKEIFLGGHRGKRLVRVFSSSRNLVLVQKKNRSPLLSFSCFLSKLTILLHCCFCSKHLKPSL